MKSLKNIPRIKDLLDIHPQTKAIFFDMDGTLCDSEHLHAKAMEKIGLEYNIQAPYPPDIIHQKLVGKADHLVYEEVKTWPGFPPHLDSDSFRNLKSSNLLSILDTPQDLISAMMMEFLVSIKESKLTLALVTSSEKVITHKILLNTKVDHLFDFVLTRDDCPFHKPDPWPYLKAIELSKAHSNECIIFEDSQVGLTAAHGSGANYFKVEWF